MKNTVLTYDTEELDEFIVSDYFSKSIDIYTLFDDVTDMIQTYKINDNDKMERISYELYGTTDYWDILSLLNQRDPLFDMPYDYTTIYENTNTFFKTYAFYIYSHAPLDDEVRYNELLEEYISDAEEENENNRYIYIIKPSSIGDFIKLLKENNYI